MELPALEVGAIDVGNLVLAPGRRPQLSGNADYVVVEEIQTRDRVVRSWRLRLLDDVDGSTVRPQLDDAVTLRISHRVAKDRRALAA